MNIQRSLRLDIGEHGRPQTWTIYLGVRGDRSRDASCFRMHHESNGKIVQG